MDKVKIAIRALRKIIALNKGDPDSETYQEAVKALKQLTDKPTDLKIFKFGA